MQHAENTTMCICHIMAASSSADPMGPGHPDDKKKDDDRKKDGHPDDKKKNDDKTKDAPWWGSSQNAYNFWFNRSEWIRPVHSSDEEDDKKKDDDKTKDDDLKQDDDKKKDDDLKKDDDKKEDDDLKKDDDKKEDDPDIESLFKGKKRLTPEQAARAAKRAALLWAADRFV